jgi:hypothetical protein
MGYRSEVVLAMKDEKFAVLLKTMDDRTAANFFEGIEPKKKNNWILIHFSDVKWYDSFEEVTAVNNFVNTLDEGDFSYHILGEEDNDYTHKGTWETPFNISLHRSLDYIW